MSPWQRSTRLRIALPVKDKSRFRQSWMWRRIGIFRLGRKLQHRRALTFAKMRDQHNLTVGKFQRIMMGQGVVGVDTTHAHDEAYKMMHDWWTGGG